jgi:hypothetical protein
MIPKEASGFGRWIGVMWKDLLGGVGRVVKGRRGSGDASYSVDAVACYLSLSKAGLFSLFSFVDSVIF